MSAFFHLDARPEKESQSFYRIWRIGIARDYSIASLAANTWNFKTRFQRSGNFSGSSRQVLQQLADGETRLQQNPLVSIDSYVRAQRNDFADRALQRFFLRNGERLSQVMA